MESTDWEARANREAAAIIMGSNLAAAGGDYNLLRQYVAIGWLQGYQYGAHETLSDVDAAFGRLQKDLL